MGKPSSNERAEIRDLALGRGLVAMCLAWLVVAVQAGLIVYFLVVDPARQKLPLPVFLSFVLLAGAITYWWNSRRRWIAYVAEHGETVEGRVVALGESYDRGGNLPFVRFHYTVAGREYSRKYFYLDQEVSYREGQTVTVRFDPRNPKRAVLG